MTKQNILVYRWGSLSEPSLCRELSVLGYGVFEFAGEMKDYHADSVFAEKLIQKLHRDKIQVVFSYDYFPLVAMICDVNHIPYISWIYDCPLHTLNSRTILLDSNYIFCFDRIYTDRLLSMGAKHCFHMPLAYNPELGEVLKKDFHDNQKNFQCELSFVGSLYNEDKNRLRKASLSDYTRGFTDALINSQMLVYGYNFLEQSLDSSSENVQKAVCEISEKCELSLGENYFWSRAELAASMIGMEVTARERMAVISEIARKYPMVLYTGSKLPEQIGTENIDNRGYADYSREVPLIFRDSRINLNITSKTIESGIPQRVLDILSCGGFCMTNYQTEIEEFFRDGVDLVMYTGMEDLLEKVSYYLEHEDARRRIAQEGKKKVTEEFRLSDRLQAVFDVLHEG